MKTFKKWLHEDTPANSIGGGFGIRGLGNVTGDPGGTISNYAINNASEQGQVTTDIQTMHDFHNAPVMNTDSPTLDGGDQPSNVLGRKGSTSKGGGTANYKGSIE